MVFNFIIERSENVNEIDKYMTINEAAQRWNISVETIKNKLKPSITDQKDIDSWIKRGLIKPFTKKGGTNKVWIISIYFMELHFGDEKRN